MAGAGGEQEAKRQKPEARSQKKPETETRTGKPKTNPT